MDRIRIGILVAILTAILTAITWTPTNAAAQSEEERPRNRFEHDILIETFGYDESTPASVEFKHLYQGCPSRDCIPSIDQPE